LAPGIFQRLNPDELSFEAGERLKIIKEAYDKGWYIAELIDGQQGLVPETHLIFEVTFSSTMHNCLYVMLCTANFLS